MKSNIQKTAIQKNIVLLIILLISINTIYAQSIGVTPSKTVEVKTNTPTSAYFSVSQGADYPEKITIERTYKWLTIEEREFVLESKTGKTIKVDINLKRAGTYTANLRVCGSPITSDGAILSTKACASHKLTVIATSDKDIKKEIITIAAILFIIASTYYIAELIKKDFLTKNTKKKRKKK